MTDQGDKMDCAETARYLHVYVDGEFEGPERLDIEAHLHACAACAETARHERAFVARLRETLRADPPATPPSLRPRIAEALAVVDRPRMRLAGVARWGAPAVAAAAVLTALVWKQSHRPLAGPPLLAEAVSRHQRELPVEVRGPDPELVRTWFRGKLDVPVRPPALSGSRARLIGARMSHLGTRQAAYLVYDVGGSTVSVFVFDPEDPSAGGGITERLQRRTVGGREIYVGGTHGYNVAVVRSGGLGYAFTSDLPQQRMLDLLATSFSF
jgi:anti-sigma factor RsiW